MNIAGAGTLTTDDSSLVDSGGGPTAPSVSLASPSAGSTLTGPVTFSANASSSVGISRVDYLVNGAVAASSSTGPSFSATWESSTVGDGPVTITARATDVGGNQATSSGTTATVSNAASHGGNMLANASVENYSSGTSVPTAGSKPAPAGPTRSPGPRRRTRTAAAGPRTSPSRPTPAVTVSSSPRSRPMSGIRRHEGVAGHPARPERAAGDD